MSAGRRTSAAGEVASSASLKVQRGPSLTEQAYQLIRGEILSRRLRAGDRLVERTLAERFQLSKTPIREAIGRLERDGLVVIVPSRGAVVRRLRLVEVIDLLECRQALDSFAARQAAKHIKPGEMAELKRLLDQAERAHAEGLTEEYRESDVGFHRRIREVADNATLLKLMEGLESQVRLVMTSTTALPGRVEASMAEHRRILAAFEARDPEAAAQAAWEHVDRMLEAVKRYWATIERGEV